MRTERTRADARKSCKLYAADLEIINGLRDVTAIWYVKMLLSVAENQSSITSIHKSDVAITVLDELTEHDLIGFSSNLMVFVNDASQRLNITEKARKQRYNQRQRDSDIKELVDKVIKNPKPDGVPDNAVVWGGNVKRWGLLEDVILARGVHNYVSRFNPAFSFGITLINQCRLMRQELGIKHNEPVALYSAIERVFKSGKKLTINNMRLELQRAGL